MFLVYSHIKQDTLDDPAVSSDVSDLFTSPLDCNLHNISPCLCKSVTHLRLGPGAVHLILSCSFSPRSYKLVTIAPEALRTFT